VFFESPDGAFGSVAAILLAKKKFFKAVDASLSRVWSFGLKPLTVNYWWMLSYALTHFEADLDFIGTTLM
jgi:hypothetical protein